MLFTCIRYITLKDFSLDFLSFIVPETIQTSVFYLVYNFKFVFLPFYFEFEYVKKWIMIDFYHVLYLNLEILLFEMSQKLRYFNL